MQPTVFPVCVSPVHHIPELYVRDTYLCQREVDLSHCYYCICIVIGFVLSMLLAVSHSDEINELSLLINMLVFGDRAMHSRLRSELKACRLWLQQSGSLSQRYYVPHRDCRLSDVPLEGAVVPTQSRRAHLARSVNSPSSSVGGIKKK